MGKEQRTWKPENPPRPIVPRPGNQCKAHKVDGTRCKKPAMRGQFICVSHGGGAPQNRKAARERLAELIDPIIARLVERVKEPGLSTGDLIRIGHLILDRTGVGPTANLKVDSRIVKYDLSELSVEQLAAKMDALQAKLKGLGEPHQPQSLPAYLESHTAEGMGIVTEEPEDVYEEKTVEERTIEMFLGAPEEDAEPSPKNTSPEEEKSQ